MQQINLYLPEFQPNREPFRAIHLVFAIPVFIVFLVGVSIASFFHAKELEANISTQEAMVKKLQFQLQVLKANKPPSANQSLELQLAESNKRLEQRKQILDMVTREDFGNMSGFSGYLAGFSAARLPDIALEQFNLEAGGTYVAFSGSTRSASLVPELVQRLRGQASFTNARMGVMEIAPAANGYLQFSVGKSKDERGGERK